MDTKSAFDIGGMSQKFGRRPRLQGDEQLLANSEAQYRARLERQQVWAELKYESLKRPKDEERLRKIGVRLDAAWKAEAKAMKLPTS